MAKRSGGPRKGGARRTPFNAGRAPKTVAYVGYWRNLKKALKWIGSAILLLAVLPLAVVIAINAVDETLDPKAARYGEPRAPGVPDGENGYYAMLALGAADGADGMQYAKAWVAEARAAAKENRMEKHAEPERARRPVLCDFPQAQCLDEVRANAGEVRSQLDAYQEDIARYDTLIAYRHYEEVLDFQQRMVTSMPRYSQVMEAQKAYLLRAAIAAGMGNLGAAIDAIERDLVFQRAMLGSTRTLHGQAIAATAYVRDLAFIAALLRGRGQDVVPHIARLREMLKPIGATVLRVSPALEAEFATAKSVLRNPVAYQGDGRRASRAERVGIRLFYKPNTTINLAYRQFMAAATAVDAPAQRLTERPLSVPQPGGPIRVWDYINNPVGNSVLRLAVPDFGAYALRLHDLDAYNRLIGLWVEMIAAGVRAEGAADFVAKSDPRLHDPYTQKPMHWDAAKKRVYFEAQGSFAKRRTDGVENGKVYFEP